MIKYTFLGKVEKDSILEESLLNELEGTQVFKVGNVHFQFSSITRIADNELDIEEAKFEREPEVFAFCLNGESFWFRRAD
jgi:hypothetical protein